MNRTEYIQRFTNTNKRYEDKYLPKVQKALMPVGLVPALHRGGINAGISFLHVTIHNPQLSKVIEDLYLEVGLRYARMNYTRMNDEVRTGKTGIVKLKEFNYQRWTGKYSGNEKQIHKEFNEVEDYNRNQLKNQFGDIPFIQLKRFGFNEAWTNFIKQYLQRFLIEKITFDVSTTTRDKLLEVLNQAVTEGWSVDRTVKEIEDLPFLKFQAARIVRTEVGRAANVGTKAQSETFPYEQMKEWISAHDKRVRGLNPDDHASHIGLDGTRINAGDLFKDPRNGDLLDHPGDPRASAESTINCRCTVAYTAKRDANGRLIPKRQTTSVIFPNQNISREIITV